MGPESEHDRKPDRPLVFHPPAYRGVLAGWPQDRRERWGRRANELEESGLSWRDAEAQAFVEIWNQTRLASAEVQGVPTAPEPGRN